MRQGWLDIPVRIKGALLVALPLVALLAVIALLLPIQLQERRARAVVVNARNLVTMAQSCLVIALDAETGMRGYAATGETLFLQPYTKSLKQFPAALASFDTAAVKTTTRMHRSGPGHYGAKSRVLYIDDNLASVQVLDRLLANRANATLYVAMSGQIGVDLARQHHPTLILLDLHLPDLGGDIILQRLHAHPTTSQIPVVILSADANASSARRLLEAGASSYRPTRRHYPSSS